MDDYSDLLKRARHAAAYPDVRPISYRLVYELIEALEKEIERGTA